MSDHKPGHLLYEGKAKRIYAVKGESELLWLEYKDSLTAFNAQKKGSFEGKGAVNRNIASLIFRFLNSRGVKNHWVEDIGQSEMLCRKVKIIPLEVVVRNRLAGSTAKKFGFEEGTPLSKPLVEFYYKSDALQDPFLSDDQALMIKAVNSREELDQMRQKALIVNERLIELFSPVGIDLIDFKIEFGFYGEHEIILADEISPDSCRLWDKKTGERLDKDRFRRDLGLVEESYRQILNILHEYWEKKL